MATTPFRPSVGDQCQPVPLPPGHPGPEHRLVGGHGPDGGTPGCDMGVFGHSCRQGWTLSATAQPS
ncbi:hypothetical protein [Streptomyces sp. NPDC051001]|uniref:hypothetical protein n=1 Tax=Streptomyces sp. NPDC051001 TaxID=3155795 RepID=UPI00344246A3